MFLNIYNSDLTKINISYYITNIGSVDIPKNNHNDHKYNRLINFSSLEVRQ